MTATQALRYNEWKPQWSLVDFGSLEPMVRGLEYWAKKYSKDLLSLEKIVKYIQLWQNNESVRIVTSLKTSVLKDYVLPVIEMQHWQSQTVYDVEKVDKLDENECVLPVMSQNELKDHQKIWVNINNITIPILDYHQQKQKIEKETLWEDRIQNILLNLNETIFYEDLKSTESLKIFINPNVNEAVEYALQRSDYTLTIIIKQENTVVSFVLSAICEFDCLMILFDLLKKLWIIWNEIQIKDISIHNSWIRNWTKGFPREKLLESMMRHMIALMDWEEVDPESGVPHIGLIQCNAMFYAYHSKRNSFITND